MNREDVIKILSDLPAMFDHNKDGSVSYALLPVFTSEEEAKEFMGIILKDLLTIKKYSDGELVFVDKNYLDQIEKTLTK